ncbi:diaminobutyrate acetyltransferase [Salisediminibacterium halotolerans]|uniref:L-2,4-diaminobutyric acid acetyltransferase n=1 Tax=Salisediminibacterium halotolerans TaxID=517425 RepID=A0A1H9RSN2_9BACI|nr:diaminobutyrate acetyltransferase [Salisediminibacterium haloalkalitolerans]SER74929.1 L-2,4-diaminobutyric acid acetyltransferase [Salisediminibacterium haloalkalitolerans]
MSERSAAMLDSLTFGKPTKFDGKKMWALVKESTLDLNSAYKYLMMAEYFSETCVIVKEKDDVVGFITGFIEPDAPDTVFVWQIGVAPSQQGKGLASKMLSELITRPACRDVRYVEATVTADNEASKALFTRFAKKNGTDLNVFETFPEDAFPDGHDAEFTYRIGPISE